VIRRSGRRDSRAAAERIPELRQQPRRHGISRDAERDGLPSRRMQRTEGRVERGKESAAATANRAKVPLTRGVKIQ